ncbi:myeloid differentiation primary response protein MyD88-like isoform X2 [Pollicipes pollicipes]|uniref:myeloid differentiation primary response protein MyD88-like isoform X2 n=1 Tax=Pollicipes pollicipes TaxID=41117 RepID=UPI001885171E|nr:myeloid differentiation primary response protein MyD88-like isoform X2 [Pollicipes pollicipes]
MNQMDELNTVESPIVALTEITKEKLALLLNGKKILPSDDGFPRDWRGVAQCLDCDNDVVQQLGRSASPTVALLERCRARPVADLWRALQDVGRWDVQDDARYMIEDDVRLYQERLSSSAATSSAVSLLPGLNDADLLCVGDAECLRAGRPLPTFDAFLLYDDGDTEFAAQIIERMEARGIKLCDKERHLLPGVTFEHQGIIRLMETRCHRVLAVLSPQFLQSAVNKFLAMFAQALGLDKRGRMLLPCVYQKCTLPSYLMYCSRLDFTRGVGLVNAWDKMYETLSVAMVTRTRSASHSVTDALPAPAAAKPRSDSTPCCASTPPDDPPAAETSAGESSWSGRAFLRNLKSRLRSSESADPAEQQVGGEADGKAGQERRAHRPKLFTAKDKQKTKAKREKKKEAKALMAA